MNRRTFSVLALGAVLTAGCNRGAKRTPHIRVEDYQRREGDPVIRIACVGDSITYGASIPDREQASYPAQLAALMGPRFVVRNFGHSGATASREGDLPYRTTPEFQALPEFAPEVILLTLGTNDTKPQNWRSREAFEVEFRALLDSLKALSSRPKIWVCFPPPVYRDEWGINAQTMDTVLEAIENVCDREKIPVIDLFDALSGQPGMFPDGVHPNARGAELMAKTIYQAIRP